MSHGRSLLMRTPAKFAAQAERYGLSLELTGACCNMPADAVSAALEGRGEFPLHLRVFFSLFAGTSRDAKAAIKKAVADAAGLSKAEWRKLPGYSRYEISDDGRVRRGWLELKLTPTGSGHLNVTLYSDGGRQWRVGVHHIMALAFHGTPPEGKPFACHKNGFPAENLKDNLYWGSRAENAADMVRHASLRRNGGRVVALRNRSAIRVGETNA